MLEKGHYDCCLSVTFGLVEMHDQSAQSSRNIVIEPIFLAAWQRRYVLYLGAG